jgi:hypothetical protein
MGNYLPTCKSRSALAGEGVPVVVAGASILAGSRLAVVNFVLAAAAGESRLASTFKAINLVLASAAVATGVGSALVVVDFARAASPSRVADTLVREQSVDAHSVYARVFAAKVDLFLATFSGETSWTFAAKVVQEVSTLGSQQAGTFSTVI